MRVETEVTTRHTLRLSDEESFVVEKRRTGKQVLISFVEATRRGGYDWRIKLVGANVLKSGQPGALTYVIDRYNFTTVDDYIVFMSCSHQVQDQLTRLGVFVRG